MLIEIKDDVFKNTDFKSLNCLIQILTYKQRYELFLDLSVIKNLENYERLDIDDKSELEIVFNLIMQEGLDINPTYFVSKKYQDRNYFDVEEAIIFFNQSVSIILENSLNDQYFLNAIINHFDETGEVKRHLNNAWIQFENAGGCTNVENFISAKLQSFNNLSCLYNKNNYFYLRCFVLLDSDKEHPNAPIDKYTKLFNFLNENNITSHILEKRCMENYMPDGVFDSIATTDELKKWRDAYFSLNEEQKDFLNISSGFSPKNQDGSSKVLRNQLKPETQDLYSTVSNSNFDILDKGFRLPSFKTEFPKNFESHHQVYKVTLQARCGTDELKKILDKIEALL